MRGGLLPINMAGVDSLEMWTIVDVNSVTKEHNSAGKITRLFTENKHRKRQGSLYQQATKYRYCQYVLPHRLMNKLMQTITLNIN